VFSSLRKTSSGGAINFLIEHQCPQCGAPAVLNETDRLFSCSFCRVRSYLVTKDCFRYLLPSSIPQDNELIYFPYWRFKGMLFSCLPGGIRHKFLDVSHLAVPSAVIPVSLGLRSQALKLRFVAPSVSGRFLEPAQSFDAVVCEFQKRFANTLPKPILHHCHIGESVSLVYSPFVMGERLVDAVINQPVGPPLTDDFAVDRLPGGRPDWRVDFVPALCPNCGWDLEGERDALVLFCRNCTAAWYPAGTRLTRLPLACLADDHPQTLYIPFWRIQAQVDGVNLNSYADLVRLANLPRVALKGWDNIPFYFWISAVKVRPRVYVRLSSNMTLCQPQDSLLSPHLPKTRIYPTTMPIQEAVESLKINLASFMKPSQELVDKLPQIQVTPQRFSLILIPFREGYHDYVQPRYQLAVNKNMLALSKSL
jgi:hypothetical protein